MNQILRYRISMYSSIVYVFAGLIMDAGVPFAALFPSLPPGGRETGRL
jgi:hypothetical protein